MRRGSCDVLDVVVGVVVGVVMVAVVVGVLAALTGCQGPRVAWVTGCNSDAAPEVVKGLGTERVEK